MLGILFSTGTEAADPLSDVAAADAFWRRLPRNDAFAAQRRVGQALADFTSRDRPDKGRLRALLALDSRARPLLDTLFVNYVPGNPQPRSVEAPSWQAAFELYRAFGAAHGHVLRTMRNSLLTEGCREHLPYVLLRLFQNRRLELLLRPFVDERSTRFPWKELHEAYRLARASGGLHHRLPVSGLYNADIRETTLEREYILVLLQDLVNGGQLPPQDAFWASQRVPRWCQPMKLEQHGVQSAAHRLGVDLDGDAGPARLAQESAGHWRYLDTAPALASIEGEISSLQDAPGRPDEDSSLGRGRQLKLLRKLRETLKPERPVIARRGERTPMALTVEVAVGMAQILGKLRKKPEESVAARRQVDTGGQEETFTATGGFTEIPTGTFPGSSAEMPSPSANAFDTPHPPLTMVDRSDSGCRLHGPTHPANPIMPGALVAFRDDSTSSWSLGVVRRVRKRLGGKRSEIGVEYLGQDARRVVVVPDAGAGRPDRASPDENARFAAIYLPGSASHPALPFKTLVLPSRGNAQEDRLSVRSRAAVYTIVLKEPLEEQADFTWSPFDIVDRWLKDEPGSVAASSAVR